MGKKYRKIIFSTTGLVLMALFSSPASAESILGEEWEKFFKEKVSFGGFVENTSGVSVGAREPFFQHVEPFRHEPVYHSARIQRRHGRVGEILYFMAFRRGAPL